MKVFFLDTNIFLQCQELQQLPWSEVSDGEDLLLLISRPVQDEIDRLKQDGNSRRTKRARKASSFLRDIVLSETERITLRASRPNVEIAVSPPVPSRVKSEILDPSRPDDRIIEEALAYYHSQPDVKVALLTHDTNPMLTAKRCGLPFVVVPDTWLLPAEPDPRDKEIGELKQKVRALERSYPQIDITVESQTGECLASLPMTVTTYEALPEQVIKEIMAEVQDLHPVVTEFNKNKNDVRSKISVAFLIEYRYQPPPEFEIQKYRETDYPQWLEKVENFFRQLHRRLQYPTRQANFSFVLRNQGTVPAENLIVEFHALGGLLLKLPADEGNEKMRLEIFPPPTPPEGKWIKQLSLQDLGHSSFDHDAMRGLMPTIFRREERDRYAFYSRSESSTSSTDRVSFECDEFRHRVDPSIVDIIIRVPSKRHIERGAIECVVTAKNLPTPRKETFPIQVEYNQDDTTAWAKKIVEEERQRIRPKLCLNIGKDGKVRIEGSDKSAG